VHPKTIGLFTKLIIPKLISYRTVNVKRGDGGGGGEGRNNFVFTGARRPIVWRETEFDAISSTGNRPEQTIYVRLYTRVVCRGVASTALRDVNHAHAPGAINCDRRLFVGRYGWYALA